MMCSMGKERPLLQRCSVLIASTVEKLFWSFCLSAVMWSFQRITYYSLDIASLILYQPDKMTSLTFCPYCHLHAQNTILEGRHSVFCYTEKWARLPAKVCLVCQSRYVHGCILEDFFPDICSNYSYFRKHQDTAVPAKIPIARSTNGNCRLWFSSWSWCLWLRYLRPDLHYVNEVKGMVLT